MPLASKTILNKGAPVLSIVLGNQIFDRAYPHADLFDAKAFAMQSPFPTIVVKTGSTDSLFPYHTYTLRGTREFI